MVTDAIIFDFDDTLVATNVIFEQVRQEFFSRMAELGFEDQPAVAAYLNQADIKNVLALGYMGKDCFPRAMGQTYRHFSALAGREPDCRVARGLEDIGWQVYDLPAEYLPGAEELLEFLQGRARLFLLTQGDQEIQQRRLQRRGVLRYFDDYRIVAVKNPAAYSAFLAELRISASNSWMVGNSLRSDINPALSVGLRAVHYQLPAWEFEHEEAIGAHYSITNLLDLKELLTDEDQNCHHSV